MQHWPLIGWWWAGLVANLATPPPASAASPDIDFRCTQLKLQPDGQTAQATGDIIMRLQTAGEPVILLCCDQLETAPGQSSGRLGHLVCRGDVRLWRAGLTIWADQVSVDLTGGIADFTGRPLAARDDSQVAAERIRLSFRLGEISLLAPRGSLIGAPQAPPNGLGASGGDDLGHARSALPARCRLPPRPQAPPAAPASP